MCHPSCSRGQGPILSHSCSLFLLCTHCVSTQASNCIGFVLFLNSWKACVKHFKLKLKRQISHASTHSSTLQPPRPTQCASLLSLTVTLSLMGVTRPTTSPNWPRCLNKTLCVCRSVCVSVCALTPLSVCSSLSHLITRAALRWDTKALAGETVSCLSFFSASTWQLFPPQDHFSLRNVLIRRDQ